MHTYRAYRLDKKKRFKTGCWLDASNDQEAKRQASDLCEDGAASVEIWRDSKRIDEIDCDRA
jgi:hypothetical protein